MINTNKEIAEIFYDIKKLLDIKGDSLFRIRAYEKAGKILENLPEDVKKIYKEKKLKGLKEISGIGISSAKKIEEYIKKGKIKYYEKMKEETAIRQIITCFFATKGLSLEQLKYSARKRKIIYSRFTKPAKQLLELACSIEKAEAAINKVAEWAKSRKLDYAIETVFKKWLELDQLKPKEIVKKPFFRSKPMIWSETKRKWYVIGCGGEWLEFAGKDIDIEWKN
ncbi:MAG: polymerase beta family protein [Parcubacteria group bacterium GW2011_GWC2_39_11]|nr:MAG: polymerase beta family protein [Parcubacteria group bacterium GW2011_GWA2_38_27]KKQ98688.1 MAG: polymerase beta family protein [Parcubacteria group bacterium GW2011_GWC2_39_11]